MASCFESSEQRAAGHLERGDRYVGQRQWAAAVIEYKNAARADPHNLSTHWRLANLAVRTGELPTALAELERVIALDPGHYEAHELLGQLYLAADRLHETARIAAALTSRHPRRPAGHRLTGRVAARHGHLPEAMTQFEQAIAVQSDDLDSLVALGDLALLRDKPDQALSWYDRAVDAHPRAVSPRVARGNYLFSAGRTGDAERDFDQAGLLADGAEEALVGLAVHHVVHGRWLHAERQLTQLVEQGAGTKARILLAELYLELGRIAEAEPLVTSLQSEGGAEAIAEVLRGRMALAERRRYEARALLEQAIQRDPGLASAHTYLGELELVEGRTRAAEAHLLRAIRLDPSHAKARLNLANVYLTDQAFAKAEELTREVLRHDPAHVQAAVLYAESFLLRDEWGKAESIYAAMAESFPANPIGPAMLGRLKSRQGVPGRAAEHLAEAVARAPHDDVLMADYLLALVAGGRSAEAGRLLAAHLAQAPHDPSRWDLAGRFHLANGQAGEAEAAFSKAIELAPGNPRYHYQLSEVYRVQNDPAKAIPALEKVLEKDDAYEAAHVSLGSLLAMQGQREQAEAHFRRALELRPSNAVAANNLAASLVEQGADLNDALRYGRLALEGLPRSPQVLDTVGWIYFKQGKLDEAYPLVSAAAGRLADDPIVRYHHAKVLASRGEKAMAAAELEAALSLSRIFPGAGDAAATLAALRE